MQNVFRFFSVLILSAYFFSEVANAERYRGVMAPTSTRSSAPATTSLKASSSASQAKPTGGIEVRPQVETSQGAFNSENSLWLGMNFNSWSLLYNQDIDTSPSNDPKNPNSGIIQNGHVKVKFPSIWTDGRTTFSDEFRIYAPTNADKRDAGMVTALRNYFNIAHKVSPTVTFNISEVPIIHVYSDAGYLTSANPIFENRVILGLDFALTDRVTLSIPIHFYVTKYREYVADVANSNDWDPNLFFWPELNWRINGGPVYLGAAYRSNNLTKVTPDKTSSDFNGVVQGVFGVNF